VGDESGGRAELSIHTLDHAQHEDAGAVIERTGVMVGRAVASAAAIFDLRLVLLSGSVPATFGQPLLEAASRELDQRSRIGFLRSMPDRARPLVQLGLTSLGRESPLIGAAGLARLALRQAPRTKSAG